MRKTKFNFVLDSCPCTAFLADYDSHAVELAFCAGSNSSSDVTERNWASVAVELDMLELKSMAHSHSFGLLRHFRTR